MKDKFKILFISASSKSGGGPSHIFTLKNLLEKEFNLFYAIPRINHYQKNINSENHLIIKERMISITDICRIIKFSQKHSIDLIHAHGKGAVIIARLVKLFIRKPLVYTPHGIHIKFLNKFIRSFYLLYEKIFGVLDDYKIFVSKSEFNYALSLNIFANKDFVIINNSVKDKPIKTTIKNQLLINKKIGITNNHKNIISISRLVDQKNIFEIFNIAKVLNMYNFLILGDGYLHKELKSLLLKENIKNVFLLGNIKNIYKYLYSSEIFLSTSFYEGHPISILEAMSIGLPIVASKVTGNIDTITSGYSGFFYRLGDINQAKYFIEKILKNNELKLKFSSNAFSTHRKLFTKSKMKSSYISLYNKYR